MAAVISIIAIIVLAGALLFAGDKNPGTNTKVKKPTTTCTGKEITVKGIKSLQRCQLQDMLTSLEKVIEEKNAEEAKKAEKCFAMCYAIDFTGTTAEPIDPYYCPSCGEKTSYVLEKGFYASFTALREMRQLVPEISRLSGIYMHLEEISLCKSCSPEDAPWFVKFVTTFADGTIYIKILYTPNDLHAMLRFFTALKENPKSIEKLSLSDIESVRDLLGIQYIEEKK